MAACLRGSTPNVDGVLCGDCQRALREACETRVPESLANLPALSARELNVLAATIDHYVRTNLVTPDVQGILRGLATAVAEAQATANGRDVARRAELPPGIPADVSVWYDASNPLAAIGIDPATVPTSTRGLLVVPKALTDAELKMVEGYIEDEWMRLPADDGIDLLLPSRGDPMCAICGQWGNRLDAPDNLDWAPTARRWTCLDQDECQARYVALANRES